jgi:hypothetical protein
METEKIKKITEEDYVEEYEIKEESIGKVIEVFEDKVLMIVKHQNNAVEQKLYSKKIPFIEYLEIGQFVAITTYYNYDIFTEIYEELEGNWDEAFEQKEVSLVDVVKACDY